MNGPGSDFTLSIFSPDGFALIGKQTKLRVDVVVTRLRSYVIVQVYTAGSGHPIASWYVGIWYCCSVISSARSVTYRPFTMSRLDIIGIMVSSASMLESWFTGCRIRVEGTSTEVTVHKKERMFHRTQHCVSWQSHIISDPKREISSDWNDIQAWAFIVRDTATSLELSYCDPGPLLGIQKG